MNSPRYRIAMVAACPYPVPQGSQVLIRDTARMLRDRGHEVHLFTYAHGLGECPAGLNVRRSTNVPGARRTKAGPSFAKPMQDFRLLQTLRDALRQESFDCVYAHNYEGLAVALAAGHRPIVYHAHNAMADELPHYVPFKAAPRAFGRWLDRALPKRADLVIAPHRCLADYLVNRGCDRDRIRVLPPAVDAVTKMNPVYTDELAPILYTGNLDAYQNIALLEEAIAIARKSNPQLEWIVATSEPACPLRGATHVHTPDHASVCAVLSRDVVVACPRVSWSGYPIKLLNAMAAGRAIVACESAAYPLRNEENGLVVPDNVPIAFAEAMIGLASDRECRQRLGAAANATVRETHNETAIGNELETALSFAIASTAHAGLSDRVVSSR